MRVRKSYPPDFKSKIVMEILRREKSIVQLSIEYGIHTTQLKQWRNIVIGGLPGLFAGEQRAVEKLKKEHTKESQDLHAEIGRLMNELSWLKKNLACRFTRDERQALIDWNNPHVSISAQARLLDLNRPSLYKRHARSEEKVRLKHRIDEIYPRMPLLRVETDHGGVKAGRIPGKPKGSRKVHAKDGD